MAATHALMTPRLARALALVVATSVGLSGLLPISRATAIAEDTAVPQPPTGPSTEPWPSAKLSGGRVADIAAGNSGFVAVGAAGRSPKKWRALVWTSPDGLTWTRVPARPEFRGAVMDVVTAFGDGYVALGRSARNTRKKGGPVVAWYSADGTDWQRRAVRRGFTSLDLQVEDIAAGPDSVLAIGSFIGQDIGAQRLWRSVDGQRWTAAKPPQPADAVDAPSETTARTGPWSPIALKTQPEVLLFFSLAAAPEGLLLFVGADFSELGDSDRVWSSADGVEWQSHPGPADGFVSAAVTGDAGRVVAIGGSTVAPFGPAMWFAQDLDSWERVLITAPDDDQASEVGSLRDLHLVDRRGSGFVAVGTMRICPEERPKRCERAVLVIESADGRSWSESEGPDGLPGPDPGIGIRAVASHGDATVFLRRSGDGSTVVWRMPLPSPKVAPVDSAP
jgi:hypothetical protein